MGSSIKFYLFSFIGYMGHYGNMFVGALGEVEQQRRRIKRTIWIRALCLYVIDVCICECTYCALMCYMWCDMLKWFAMLENWYVDMNCLGIGLRFRCNLTRFFRALFDSYFHSYFSYGFSSRFPLNIKLRCLSLVIHCFDYGSILYRLRREMLFGLYSDGVYRICRTK